ncbi:MAG: radical SAM protein, partial [Thermodesulfobacteriota bacterium]
MEQETKVSLRSALGEGAESHLTKLERLWRALKERKFPYQVGPYPPDHGEKHINKVLLNLCDLLISYRKNDPLSAKEKSYLFAAGMVHDIGMIRMRSTGADGPAANAVRISHPNAGQIASVAVPELSSASFLPTESVTIIKIASAHASDPLGGSAIKKIAELKASVGAGEAYVPWCAILLQAADLFDIGPDRLTLDVADQGWSPDQIVHYKKHATVKVQMYPESLDVKISLTEQHEIAAIKKITEIPAIEQAIILDNVYHEIEEKVRYLNEELKFTRIPWHVVADERLFGRPLPLGPSPGSFETTFDEALSQWRLQYVGQPFPVAMMGHSLYGRFVGDAENLNEKILHALEAGEIHLRVLVLDPNVENQQMCEVYDGQMVSPAEQGRSILPSYDAQGKVAEDNDKERGDILQTLHKLSRDWVPRVHGGSLLEVRATTRIMYTSISRFGDSLIVTPYRKTGLFRESQSWLYREKSPFYKAYTEVFQELWNSGSETTVRIVKVGKSLSDHNPMVEILRPLKDKQDRRDVSPLDYEHFMLSKYLDRIKAVFDLVRQPTRGPILPFEVEIQPSEECTLHCVHCVGRYLGSRRTPPAVLSCDLSSLLETEPEHPRIERFRISGLLGDPLSVGSREMVLEFLERAKKQGRDVVVLTNGLALEDRSV